MNTIVLFSHCKYSATFDNFAPGNYLLLVHADVWPYPDILMWCGSHVGRSLPSLPSPGRDQGCDWFFDSQLRQLTYLGKCSWMSILRAHNQKPLLNLRFQCYEMMRNWRGSCVLWSSESDCLALNLSSNQHLLSGTFSRHSLSLRLLICKMGS